MKERSRGEGKSYFDLHKASKGISSKYEVQGNENSFTEGKSV